MKRLTMIISMTYFPIGLDMTTFTNPNLTLIQDLKIIQHNVLCWTNDRSIELSNYYCQENPDIILLNSTSVIDNSKIKIYNYNVIQKNILNERSAGVAIAIKKTIKYKTIDDCNDDILGIELLTSKGPIIILTNYSPPMRNFIPIGEIENILQKMFLCTLLGILTQIFLP